jgi:predicted ATP-grasp superfamily ATP-dependent carboligase
MTERILLTDAQERWVLAASRGLKQQGYSLDTVAARWPAAAQWSRDGGQPLRASDPQPEALRFVQDLQRLLQEKHYSVLMLGGEASLMAASQHRDLIPARTSLGLPPLPVVQKAFNKRFVQECAVTAGLAPPPSVVCETQDEALKAATDLGFPVMMKPFRSQVLDDRTGATRHQTSRVASDRSALLTALPNFGHPIIIQRYERKSFVISFAGVFANGSLLGVAASQYLRTWPPAGGSASFSETIHPPGDLRKRVEFFLKKIGWQGIFEIEVLTEDGERFSMIDFNPRLYGSIALAIEAGANLPAIWCDWLLGRDPRPAVARPGLRYRWEEGEAYNVLWRLRRGRIREAASIVRPRSHTVHALFRLKDPAPLLAGAFYAAALRLDRARLQRRNSHASRGQTGSGLG